MSGSFKGGATARMPVSFCDRTVCITRVYCVGRSGVDDKQH